MRCTQRRATQEDEDKLVEEVYCDGRGARMRAEAGGRNVVPEMQELAATLLLHHCHCKQGYRELSKSKSRIQRGLQSFTLERGLHDNANDDDSTLARLAKTFLAFPVSSIASERVSRRLGMS